MRKILTPLQKALTNAVQVSIPTFREAQAYKMLYGMHKGKVLDEIPLKYLDRLRGERGEEGTDPLDLAIRTYLDDPTIQKELADANEQMPSHLGQSILVEADGREYLGTVTSARPYLARSGWTTVYTVTFFQGCERGRVRVDAATLEECLRTRQPVWA